MHKRTLIVICLAWCLSGCHITTPSDNTSSTFSGTVIVGGSVTHEFSSSKTGEYSITLTLVQPDAGAFLGVSLGLSQGGGCGALATNLGQKGVQVLYGPIQKGNYCVTVSDAGYLARTENYTVVVSHP